MTRHATPLVVLAGALALGAAFVAGRLSAPEPVPVGPRDPAESARAIDVTPATQVRLASERRAVEAPSTRSTALEPAGRTTTDPEPAATPVAEPGPLARRYPLLVDLVEFEGTPFTELDLDGLRGLEFMRLLRSVRAAAAVEESALIDAIPEPLRRTVSRDRADSALAGGPEVYFAKLPTSKGSPLGGARYVELTDDLTPVLRQLRDLSIEVHTHPTYEDYKLGWAGVSDATQEPLPIVEWKAEKWGARLVGYDASGTVLATSESKWLGMP